MKFEDACGSKTSDTTRMRRFRLLTAACALTALAACTNEAGLSDAAIANASSLNTGASAKTGDAVPVTTQAYAGETSSKVETSTEALIKKKTPSKPKIVRKRSTASGGSLFATLNKNNERNKPSAVTTTTRLASTRSTAKRSEMIELPGVRAKETIAPRPNTSRLGSIGNKAKALIVRPVEVASAAALGRLSKNGLRRQHSKVSVGCLRPSLVRLIKRAERHFGRHAVVTSGYRSPRHNRRVGGARKSMHVSCMAADIQIKGVSKWKLASWFRAQSNRGGVGTYCHTQSVHVDVGKKRDWNWRCKKRRRGKRRRA